MNAGDTSIKQACHMNSSVSNLSWLDFEINIFIRFAEALNA